jgi:3-oxoadipate enol-lactonase
MATAIADAIEQAVAAAGVRQLSVVGFSGGAYHALHMAVRGVLDVERVVALGAIGDLSNDERAGLRGLAEALRAGQSLDGIPTARFLSPAFAATHPEACAQVEVWVKATSPANLAIEADAVAAGPPLLGRLGSYQGRVLARTGELDLATPPSHARAIAASCRNGVAEIVEGCGHALLEEDRDETVRAALAALA